MTFEKIKYFYETGMWKKSYVVNMVKKGFITAYQYKEITGEDYPDEAAK